MIYLVGNLKNVADVNGFIERAGSASQEWLDEWGIVEQTIYGGVDQDAVIIVNAYKTLEEAQKHKAQLDSPQSKENHKNIGVPSFETFILERRVAR